MKSGTKLMWAAMVVAMVSMSWAQSAQASVYSDTVLADNPFVYYRFEETAGTVAVDSAAIGGIQNGTYVGTNVTLGGTEVGAPIGLGNSALFGTSDAFVDVPNLGGNHSQLTVETWINVDGLAAGCCTSIFSTDLFDSTGLGQSLHLNISSGRTLEHAMGGNVAVNTAGGLIQDDTWYHIVATFEGATGVTNFYLDGNLVASDVDHNSPAEINLAQTGQIAGWVGAARDLPGHVDEFAFYDSVLTAAQVKAHFDAAFVAPVPEPSTAALILFAGCALTSGRKRRV